MGVGSDSAEEEKRKTTRAGQSNHPAFSASILPTGPCYVRHTSANNQRKVILD